MSNQPEQAIKKPNDLTVKQGYGATLSKARKQRSLSVQDVAEELNILKRHVEAIEEENYAALPQFAFARGFVGNYAKLLGLDSDEFMRQFENNYPSHLKQDKVESIRAPMQPMGTLRRGQTPMKINIGLVLGVFAVVVFGLLILKMINSATNTQNEHLNAETVLNNQSPLSASEQAQGASIGSAGLAIGNLPANTTTMGVINTNSSQVVLDFWVKVNTAIEITDSVGNKLMSGTQNRGGHQITGTPPLTINITNPAQVDLNINKEPINLADHTAGDKAVLTVQ